MEIYAVRRVMGTSVKVDTEKRKLEKLQIIINIIQSVLKRFSQ